MAKKKEAPVQAPAQAVKKEKLSLDGQYPGLNGISWFVGYAEQFLAVISEPLLLICAVIAVIDFLTGGQLLAVGLINYSWAGALAVAVTACFVVTWRRSIRAFTFNRYVAGVILAILGTLLGAVDFAAIAVQALQQTMHISFEQALNLLGLDVVIMTYIRSFVALAMMVVVAISNNVSITTAVAPKRRLALWDKALDKFAPVVSSEGMQTVQPAISQPALSKQTVQLPAVNPGEQGINQPAQLSIVKPSSEGETVNDKLERVRQALELEPDCSDRRLGKLAGMSAVTAKRYRQMINQHIRVIEPGDHSVITV